MAVSGEDLLINNKEFNDEFEWQYPVGDWILKIKDNQPGNVGTLNGWSLIFVNDMNNYLN